MGIPVLDRRRLESLSPISHHIAEVVNISLNPHSPYVGTSAFTHKAGLHTSALARRPDAYEHQNPTAVGNHTRMVVSELSGKATIISKANELGVELADEQVVAVLDEIKHMEHQGYHFEAADGSFELMLRQAAGWVQQYFELESFRVFTERRATEVVVAEATVKLIIKGERMVTTGEGNGPGQRPRRGAPQRPPNSISGGRQPAVDELPGTRPRLDRIDRRHGPGVPRDKRRGRRVGNDRSAPQCHRSLLGSPGRRHRIGPVQSRRVRGTRHERRVSGLRYQGRSP